MLEFLFWIFFIFIVFGYVFRLFLRYGLPWLLTRFMQNQKKKYSESFNSNNSYNQTSDKGRVNIKKKKEKKTDDDKDDFGEYIDYEDVGE